MVEKDPIQKGRQIPEELQILPNVDVVGINVEGMEFRIIENRKVQVTPITLTPPVFREEDLEGILRLCVDRASTPGLPSISIIDEETDDPDNKTFYIQRYGAMQDIYTDFFAEELFPQAVVSYRIFEGVVREGEDPLERVAGDLDEESILDRFTRYNTAKRREFSMRRHHEYSIDILDEEGIRVGDPTEDMRDAHFEGFPEFFTRRDSD